METQTMPVMTKAKAGDTRFSPREVEKTLNEIEALQKKLQEAKNVVKLAKEAEREAAKAAKEAKKNAVNYNRMTAMCTALKDNPTGKREDVCKAADKLYVEKTGSQANVTKTARYYKYATAAYKVFVQ